MSRLKEWDEYFLQIATAAAFNSKCLSRKIGAVIVRENSVIGTGYNGPPATVRVCDTRNDCISRLGECPRKTAGMPSGTGLEICPAGHAERNALIQCAKNGVSTKETTIYMTCGIPCKDCLIEIINAGVSVAVVTDLEYYDTLSEYITKENSVLHIRLNESIKLSL